MIISFHSDIDEFLHMCLPYLCENEAANGLMIGLCLKAQAKKQEKEDFPIKLVSVTRGQDLLMVAIQTPPHNLVLSHAAAGTAEPLAQALYKKTYKFPGIVGPVNETKAFAAAWKKIAGAGSKLAMQQRIYQLDRVVPPQNISGACRPANLDDVKLVAEWFTAFEEEALAKHERGTLQQNFEKAESRINEQQVFLWIDQGVPVSLAATAISTRNGIAINSVYTPPRCRARGYASGNVAAISQKQLEKGYKFCFLYTDAGNPTSNSIYQKIGYHFAADSSFYIIE